jgi:hypothetical protein
MATTTTVPRTTTTTVDPIEAAGDYYLAVVAPSNCVFDRISKAEEAIFDDEGFFYEEDWSEWAETVQPLYAEWSQELVRFVEAVVFYEWPEPVEGDVQRLVEELSEAAGWAHGYSQVPSFAALLEYAPYPDDGGAATTIRAKLGLPTNIGLDVETACADISD